MSTTPNWTVLQVLQHATDFLSRKNIENARLNAERLLSSTLNLSRVQLYVEYERPLSAQELERYKANLTRRADHVPLQYITGDTEFMSLPFEVSADVLIPRPETEVLVETALEYCRTSGATDEEVAILDIGTGSGCIAVSLASNLPHALITAIDSSEPALNVAMNNARRNGVIDRIEFQHKNILQEASFGCTFDLIISNPPYVSTLEFQTLPEEIRQYEPAGALQDGADGLTFYRRFAAIAPALLDSNGVLMVEVGDKQADSVADCFRKANLSDAHIFNDLNGIGRVVSCKL